MRARTAGIKAGDDVFRRIAAGNEDQPTTVAQSLGLGQLDAIGVGKIDIQQDQSRGLGGQMTLHLGGGRRAKHTIALVFKGPGN